MNKSYAIGIDINDKQYKYIIDDIGFMCSCDMLKSLTIYDEDNQIKELFCAENYLEEITIIGAKYLRIFVCYDNKLTNLDLNLFNNLEYICCYRNKLKELDVSKCEKLETLVCDIELENNIKLPNHKLEYIDYDGE